MDKRVMTALLVIGGLLLAGQGWAEDKAPAVAAPVPAVPAAAQEPVPLEWVWGEVISIDAAGQALVVRYLDYETDTEKEINLKADEKTKFSGINGFSDLKAQDTISVDYTVGQDGKNKALMITYERIEDIGEDMNLEAPVVSAPAPSPATEKKE